MSIGIDLGSHAFRALRLVNQEVRTRRSRAVYAVLPPDARHQKLLDRSHVPYLTGENCLVLVGDAAVELAGTFQVPCLDLLPAGRLPETEPIPRQVTALLFEALVPPPRTQGEVCCFTVPEPPPRRGSRSPEREFFRRLIQLRGYAPFELSPGLALIHAEMVQARFSGLGLVMGASGTHITIAHRGMEAAATYVPRGSRWMDEQLALEHELYEWDAAGNKRLDLSEASRRRRSVRGLSGDPQPVAALVARLYEELTAEIALSIARVLDREPGTRDLPQPLNVICAGGATEIAGFDALLQRQVRPHKYPLVIGTIRGAGPSEFTIARGCLINAELESQAKRGPHSGSAAA